MENKSLNGSFRKKRVYYSQVSNAAIRDNKLSLKAKGLYALIQSYITIEDFILYKSTLKNMCLEGEKAFENTWKELKETGYLIQYRLQKENGHYYYEYDLLDQADPDLANEIHSNQNRKKQVEKNHTPKKVYMDKLQDNHTPKMDYMEKRLHGKVGVYNNTDYNNTDINNTNTSSSSSSSRDTLENEFNNNICELKKTTKIKFEKIIDKYNSDMIIAIIEECTLTGVKSFAGFEAAFNSYLDRGCQTGEDVRVAAEKYRLYKKKNVKVNRRSYSNRNNNNKSNDKVDPKSFNNFESREYDYKSLENKLLGWE